MNNNEIVSTLGAIVKKYWQVTILVVLVIVVASSYIIIDRMTADKSVPQEQMNPQTKTDQAEQNTFSSELEKSSTLTLSDRSGDAPEVTEGIPHIQLSQTSDDATYDKLTAEVYAIDGIVGGESLASLPGAQSIALASSLPANQNAMITGREFAHIHADPGRGSLHLVLLAADAGLVVEKGWGVYHPFHLDGRIPGMVMVFAPRNDQDLKTVVDIIAASFNFASQE